jgi:hypothetical protein
MEYFVPCECGEGVPVTEGAAGSRVTCACGRTVNVPSLRELRNASDEPEERPSPEMAIEALLLAGQLPQEKKCIVCGVPTTGAITCEADCERAVVDDGSRPLWAQVLYSSFLG